MAGVASLTYLNTQYSRLCSKLSLFIAKNTYEVMQAKYKVISPNLKNILLYIFYSFLSFCYLDYIIFYIVHMLDYSA